LNEWVKNTDFLLLETHSKYDLRMTDKI